MTKRMRDLLRLVSDAYMNNTDPFDKEFTSKNEITLDEALELQSLIGTILNWYLRNAEYHVKD